MSFITVAGQNLLAWHQANGIALTINRFVVANIPALGSEPEDRIEFLPANIYQVFEQIIPLANIGYNDANIVTYSLAMDSSVGDFDYNWIGLLSADNVLIVACHLPAALHKWKTTGFNSGNTKSHNFLLEYVGAQTLLGIDSPAQTWQIDFSNHETLSGLLGGDNTGHYHLKAEELINVTSPLFLSKSLIDTDYTIPEGYNAGSINTTIADGITVIVPNNSTWQVF